MELVRRLPKAEPARVTYLAFTNLLDVLKERGYNVSEYEGIAYEEFIDDEEFNIVTGFRLSCPPTREKNDIDVYIQSSTTKKDPIDVYIQSSTTKNDLVQAHISRYTKKKDKTQIPKPNIIAVYDKPKDLDKNIGEGSLEIMCFYQLLSNPRTHSKAPLKVQKITPEEKEELMNGIPGMQLVGIRPQDPMAIFHNAKSGDVLRYTDAKLYTGQLLTTVEYKMVK